MKNPESQELTRGSSRRRVAADKEAGQSLVSSTTIVNPLPAEKERQSRVKCSDCRWYADHGGVGTCHFHPPRVLQGTEEETGTPYPETSWPMVYSTDFCGKFREKEVAE